MLFDLSWVSLLSVRLRHFSLNGRKRARGGYLRGGKKGFGGRWQGPLVPYPLENPRDRRKRPASFTPAKKKPAETSLTPANGNRYSNSFPSTGGASVSRSTLSPDIRSTGFRNVRSESMAIYLSAFYTSIISGLSRKKWKGAQGIPPKKEGRPDDRCNRLEAPLKLFSFDLRIRSLS